MFTITYLIKLKVRARSPPKKQKQPRGEPQGKGNKMDTLTTVIIILLAVIIFFFGLILVWYQLSYEILKTKISKMYKYLKQIIKDCELDELEAEELIGHGAQRNKKSPPKDDD